MIQNMTTEPRLETLLDVPVPLSRGRERRVSLQLPPLHDATSSRITLRPLALGNIPLIVTSGQVSQSTPTPFVEKESRIVKDVSNDDDGGKNIASLHGVDQEKNGPTPGSRDLGGQNPVGDEHYSKGGRSLKAKTRWTSSKRRKVNETGFRNRPLAPLVKIHEIGAGGSKLGPLNEQKISPARTSSVLPIAALSCDAANPAVPEPLSKNGEKISQDQTSSASPGSEHVASARQRRKWTPQETQALLQGVAEHGVGNWKKILADPKYSFNDRSGIDLKDRFRTCCPDSYRKRAKPVPVTISESSPSTMPLSTLLLNSSPSLESFPPHEPSYPSPPSSAPPRSKSPTSARKGTSTSRSHRMRPEDLAELGIQGPFPNARRKERRLFTDDEDADLLRGYNMHGPQWTRIRLDAGLNLRSRRAVDLRDRFRNRYPERYAEAGFKMRPKGCSKAAARSVKKDGPGSFPMESSSSSSSASSRSSDEPGQQNQLPPEPEVSASTLHLVHDEDPTVPSISSLIDWDDNTLRPFITQASQNNHNNHNSNNNHSNAMGEMQSLLLGHIHPLLTYDPTRSLLLTSPNKSNNNSTNHNHHHHHHQLQISKPAVSTTATTVVERRSNLTLSLDSNNSNNTRSMMTSVSPSSLSAMISSSPDESASATKKASPGINLPPPTDLLLPFDLDPSPTSYSSSSLSGPATGTAGGGGTSSTQNAFSTTAIPIANLTSTQPPSTSSASALPNTASINNYHPSSFRITTDSNANANHKTSQRAPSFTPAGREQTSELNSTRTTTGRQSTFLATTTTPMGTPPVPPTSSAASGSRVGRTGTNNTTNGSSSGGNGNSTIGGSMGGNNSIQQILISPSSTPTPPPPSTTSTSIPIPIPTTTTTTTAALTWEDITIHPMFDMSTE